MEPDSRDTAEVDCANVFTDTIPVLVLTGGGEPLVALLVRGEARAPLYRGTGRAASWLPAHHAASFYDHESAPPAPIYQVHGALDGIGAYLEPVTVL